jgi:hypothetical protein
MGFSWAYLLPDPGHLTAAWALLVLGYVMAVFCWLRAGWRAGAAGTVGSLAGWWRLGAVLLFLLAINKLFNLRAQFEAAIRALVKAGGWHDQRQSLQFVFAIVLPCVLAAFVAAFLALKGRGFIRRHPLALAGWVLLLLYLALRQSQEWKPVLPWLSAIKYYDWRLVLEAAGILLVVSAACFARPPLPCTPPTPPPG